MNNNKNPSIASTDAAASEKRIKNRIVKYLNRVEIVNDSIALSLLRKAAVVLKKFVEIIVSSITKDSELNMILQNLQILIIKLEAKTSYSNVIRERIAHESTKTKMTSTNAFSNSNRMKQTRELTIIVKNEKKKRQLQSLITKKLMNKLQKEKKKKSI
jgi:ATP-dependent Lon protease